VLTRLLDFTTPSTTSAGVARISYYMIFSKSVTFAISAFKPSSPQAWRAFASRFLQFWQLLPRISIFNQITLHRIFALTPADVTQHCLANR
jgi:hypothetical protein